MNRKELKANARELLKGNIWNVWKPFLATGFIMFFLSLICNAFLPLSTVVEETFNIFGQEIPAEISNLTPLGYIFEILFNIINILLTTGSIYYLIKLVRKEEFSLSDIFKFFKEHQLLIIATSILVYIFVLLGTIFFVIPGIIIGFSLIMYSYIIADDKVSKENLKPMDVLKQSREMMKGYKWNYFVFCLSFILWYFLIGITCGIAVIYVMPYVTIAQVLYYETLKEKTKK